ncbi:MAG: FHA domain-containing protein [Deltaproteobacteria bacterium]|nr:FHA domain-containing protein [Deltaproteobacteria bacterium]
MSVSGVRLRYLGQVLVVPVGGQFAIGRSSDCQLALEDPLVSRMHAVFKWVGDSLVIEDLSSRNGVKVNDQRIDGVQVLKIDDIVGIGSQTFAVIAGETIRPREVRKAAVTMASETSHGDSPSSLLGGVVEKAFAMNRIDDAERILSTMLQDLLVRFEKEKRDRGALADGIKFSLRLANETGKSQWVDWIFDAHRILERVPPTATVDELHVLTRKIRYPVTPAFRRYVTGMKDQVSLLGPTERFAFQRLEGLMRVLSA